jgi:leader peptidase (prepilin peptidase) / N-methyltransferase
VLAAAVIGFALGLLAGSFATAVAYRVPRGMSIVGPRSLCPTCGATIAAYDNVPVFSWLILRGSSRCCGTRISPRYPLTELAVAVVVAAAALIHHDHPAEIAIDLVFTTMLAIIALTDLERRIIPNKVLLVGAVLCIAIAAPTDPGSLPERFIAAAAAGGLLFLTALAYPKGMGLGDVKLAATMGLFLGRAMAPALLAGLLFGSVIGMALMVRHGAGARKMAIPFGPFLALGGVLGMLAGTQLMNLYLG